MKFWEMFAGNWRPKADSLNSYLQSDPLGEAQQRAIEQQIRSENQQHANSRRRIWEEGKRHFMRSRKAPGIQYRDFPAMSESAREFKHGDCVVVPSPLIGFPNWWGYWDAVLGEPVQTLEELSKEPVRDE